MNCQLCGEVCRCLEESGAAPAATHEAGAAGGSAAESAVGIGLFPDNAASMNEIASGQAKDSSQTSQPEPPDAAWRDELATRLNRYRSRHKMQPPRYPSLSLRFDASEPSVASDSDFRSSFEPVSDRALALNGLSDFVPEVSDEPVARATSGGEPAPPRELPPQPRAKIIEFPRFAWAPPPPPPDQLAEPVLDRPRILEVPEVAPPPPALGGITIEPAVKAAFEKRPGIDIPLQGASLGRRIVAGVVDGMIIVAASALFGFIFWKVAAIRPPIEQSAGLAILLPFLLWSVYQYLMIVYAGSTPGLRAAGLTLSRFDGSPAKRALRRWRVLASYLSAVPLAMGYAWLFLDEDGLCWHDRITHTYLARVAPAPKP
jgi:uncharacterized RDD family membrane protein YckC